MNEFDDLESNLRPNRNNAFKDIDERIRTLERFRFWFVLIAILGTILLATSRAADIDELLWPGILCSALGLILTAAIDYRKVDLTKYFSTAEQTAFDAIEKGRNFENRLGSRKQLDRRRLAYREAANALRESLEQSVLEESAYTAAAIQFMLENAEPKLAEAINFERDEKWAISIFAKTGVGGSARMSPIAGIRSKSLPPQSNPRKWPKNKGLVGVVWHTGRDAIISDYTDARVLQDYPVPANLHRDHDAMRYASMAAIPILVGPRQEIWGVVAASTNVAERFKRDPKNDQAQEVDTVRLIAKSIALAVACFKARDSQSGDTND